jgi:uncharacterized cupin superfamily protein
VLRLRNPTSQAEVRHPRVRGEGAKLRNVRVVNVYDVELQEGPGRDGFWFRAAGLGAKLGAARIGAGIYEARHGVPIWPYHYHYPDEEWLYVLDGAPLLRDAGGRTVLETGDVVCFTAGHRGAHTIEGPGRFIIVSGERSSGPFVSVYPDSDKVSVAPGIEPNDLNALLLPRAGSVDYWHGEGSGPVRPATVTRESEGVPRPPVVNVQSLNSESAAGCMWIGLGEALQGEQLDAAILGLEPTAEFGPYRYDYGRELWLMVLTGTPTLMHRQQEQPLSPGDLVCLPEGPAGGRSLLNRGAATARMLLLWTTGYPTATCYPDSAEWVLRTARDSDEIRLRAS